MITKDRKATIDQDLVVGHAYEVAVRAIAQDGRVEAVDLAPKKTILLAGAVRGPGAATMLVATPFLMTIFLTWTNPANSDFDVTEVWRSSTDDRDTAVKVGEMRTDSFSDNIGSTGTTRYYWVRSRNTSGIVGEWNATAGVEATTTGVEATDIADFAITATKMFTNTIVLTSDSWTDHSPTSTYVAWNAHTVVYNGHSYPISAGATPSPYIYWVVGDTSYSIAASHPTLGNTGFMIAINTAGVHTKVWNSSANMVIGTAFIADLAVTNAKIANLSADKINAGTLAVTYTAAKCTVANADNTATVLTAKGIQDGATAGATWGTNVASIPARLTEGDSPATTGVYLTPNYIGFYDSGTSAWPVRIKNNAGAGEFYVGDGSKYISYASGVVTVRGDLEAIMGTDKVHITTGTFSGNDYATINLVRSGALVGFIGPYQPTVAAEPRLSFVSANGGSAYFGIGTDPFDTSNARSSFINQDIMQVITSDTGDALVYAERTGDDTSVPIVCSKYSGSGTGILFQGIGSSVTKFEVTSLGKIKGFNLQLYDTDPTITGHDGSVYTKLVFNAGTYEIKTSNTVKISIDASGNIDTAGVFKKSGTQVVGARVVDARCDDAVTSTWSATEAGVLDALRDAMISHGLISAA
jgi:hypothetical protein